MTSVPALAIVIEPVPSAEELFNSSFPWLTLKHWIAHFRQL
jgi:hypothetical protein